MASIGSVEDSGPETPLGSSEVLPDNSDESAVVSDLETGVGSSEIQPEKKVIMKIRQMIPATNCLRIIIPLFVCHITEAINTFHDYYTPQMIGSIPS